MNEELTTVKTLAVRAGEILLEHYQRPVAVHWKGKDNPVTDADRAASDFITAELQQLFPGDAVVSEENPDNTRRLSTSRVWMVDPMDGTKEFIAKRDEFAVMIGLAIDGIARLGVVYQPTSRKLYYASAGSGAFREHNGTSLRLQVPDEQNPAEMTMAVSRSHPSRRVDRVREGLGITRTIQSGSIGLKVGLICEGRAHLYLYTTAHTFQWDTCAPEAILVEAGGRMTDLTDNPLIYNTPELKNLNGVIASTGPIHHRISELALASKEP